MGFDKYYISNDSILSFTKNSPIDVLRKRNELVSIARGNILLSTDLASEVCCNEVIEEYKNYNLQPVEDAIFTDFTTMSYCFFIDLECNRIKMLFSNKNNLVDYYELEIGTYYGSEKAYRMLLESNIYIVFYVKNNTGEPYGYILDKKYKLEKKVFNSLYEEYRTIGYEIDDDLPF